MAPVFSFIVNFGRRNGRTRSHPHPHHQRAPQTVNLVEAFPGITFNIPVDIAHAGDGRLFIVEQAGRIRTATLDTPAASAPTFLDITGGFVYRGSQYPALNGSYFYADYCTGEVWSLTPNGGSWNGSLTNNSIANINSIATFGEDANGELYLATFSSSGRVYRIQEDSPAPILSIEKTAPFGVASGQPFTYTLAVTNDGNATATNLIISDTLPTHASYVDSSDGGSLNNDTVIWHVPTLAAQTTISVQLTVTITQTVINENFGVVADNGYRAPWIQPVRTFTDLKYIFLPAILK